jgi:hypothetical protein
MYENNAFFKYFLPVFFPFFKASSVPAFLSSLIFFFLLKKRRLKNFLGDKEKIFLGRYGKIKKSRV